MKDVVGAHREPHRLAVPDADLARGQRIRFDRLPARIVAHVAGAELYEPVGDPLAQIPGAGAVGRDLLEEAPDVVDAPVPEADALVEEATERRGRNPGRRRCGDHADEVHCAAEVSVSGLQGGADSIDPEEINEERKDGRRRLPVEVAQLRRREIRGQHGHPGVAEIDPDRHELVEIGERGDYNPRTGSFRPLPMRSGAQRRW